MQILFYARHLAGFFEYFRFFLDLTEWDICHIATYLSATERINLRSTCKRLRYHPGLTNLRHTLMHEQGKDLDRSLLAECHLNDVPLAHVDKMIPTVLNHLRTEKTGNNIYSHRHYIGNFEPIRTVCLLERQQLVLVASELKISVYDLSKDDGALHQTLQIAMTVKFYPNSTERLVACQIINDVDPHLFIIRVISFTLRVATLWQVHYDFSQYNINTSNVWLNDFSFMLFSSSDIRLVIINENTHSFSQYTCVYAHNPKSFLLKKSLSRAVMAEIINWTRSRGLFFLLCVRCTQLGCQKIHAIETWAMKGHRLTKTGTIHCPSPILSFKMLPNLCKYAMLCCVDFGESCQPLDDPCPMQKEYSSYEGTSFFVGYFDQDIQHRSLCKLDDWTWSATIDAHAMNDLFSIGQGIPLAFDQMWDLSETQLFWIDGRDESYNVAPCINPRIRETDSVYLQHMADYSNLSHELRYSGDLWVTKNDRYLIFSANDYASLVITKKGYKGPATCNMRSILIVNELTYEPSHDCITF